MYDEPLDSGHQSESIRQMHTLMSVALRQVLNETPQDEFLDWAQSSIPKLVPLMMENISEVERPKVAYWMGVDLWNAAPQPANHFKPLHIEKPSRNSACPCGSGFKYKQCCSRLPPSMKLPTDSFWLLMPAVASKANINRYIKSGQLPVKAITIMANQFSDMGDDAQVIKLLEPLFEGQASRLNHKQSGLLDILCDSYNNHYKTDKKKKDLLQRMCQHPDRSIRAEAWQRVSSWRLDSGDLPAAMEALAKAMQAEPDNPSHSLLELTLLVSSKQTEQAKQRAKFWRHKLKHLEFELPELMSTLERAQTDPAGALQFTMSEADDDPRLMELLQWIDDNRDLPVMAYTLESLNAPEMDEPEIDEDNPYPDPMLNAHTPVPSELIANLEMRWDGIKPVDKPFGTQLEPMSETSFWDNIFDTEWLDFLLTNPNAINSLNILDDLVTMIYIHPNNDVIWGPLGKIESLLDRADQILRQLDLTGEKNIPWIVTENRPPLRLLTHDINLAINQDEQPRAIKQIKHYLQLNPDDNHGYRSLLINHYLQSNENEMAIELAANYPNDMLAETRYGLVLALYRLGDLQGAELALQDALAELPRVAEYLIKARVAQPELSEYGISHGGEDQAWFYREEMRGSWKQTEGGLAWLKKQLK